jgi:hypothetical protein
MTTLHDFSAKTSGPRTEPEAPELVAAVEKALG